MSHRLLPVLLAGIAPLLPVCAFAADIDLASQIGEVTVYPDGASVVRTAPLRLPAGASTVIFRNLSPSIDPASIRVEGEASARLAIGAVDVRLVPAGPEAAANPELERRIDDLRAQRESLKAAIDAAEGKKAAIQRFAQAGASRPADENGILPVEKWASAWDAVGEGLAKVNETLVDLNRRSTRLDGEIAALEATRPRAAPPSAPRRDVTVGLDAADALEGTLRLTYRVSGASWTPTYDARLDTGGRDRKPSLEIVRRAAVQQKTGEDWTGVTMTVSTVRAARGTAAPDVPPLIVNLYDPSYAMRQPMAAPAPAAPAAALAARQEAAADQERARKITTMPASVETATSESAPFQSAFKVTGPVTLAADGVQRNLVLSSRRLDPTLLVRTAPALDDTAYLEASFVNDEDAPLLPGLVQLQRDGTAIGRGRIGLVASGDKADLGFGADDKVKVTRVPLRRKENEPGWIGSSKTDIREFKTVVRNLHDTPLRIAVLDQLPVSENSAVTVELLSTSTPATEKTVGDKRGVTGWTWDYQPGEQKEIRFGYRLKWPADRDLVFGAGPVPLSR